MDFHHREQKDSEADIWNVTLKSIDETEISDQKSTDETEISGQKSTDKTEISGQKVVLSACLSASF